VSPNAGTRQPQPLVMLISRDTDFLTIYSFALAHSGFAVEASETLVADPQHSSVVIVDVFGEHDWEMLAAASERSVPMIVVTGYVSLDRRFRDRARAFGAAAFVLKPVTWQELANTVRRVLQGERGIEILSGG
jgi:FixJ family two-component response regulator